jgi:hypothetical protein
MERVGVIAGGRVGISGIEGAKRICHEMAKQNSRGLHPLPASPPSLAGNAYPGPTSLSLCLPFLALLGPGHCPILSRHSFS